MSLVIQTPIATVKIPVLIRNGGLIQIVHKFSSLNSPAKLPNEKSIFDIYTVKHVFNRQHIKH